MARVAGDIVEGTGHGPERNASRTRRRTGESCAARFRCGGPPPVFGRRVSSRERASRSAPKAGRARSLLVTLGPGLLALACAQPLHQPQPLSDLVGKATGFHAADMEELLERAERLYAKRDVTSMKDAEDLFQTVAAIDRTRIDGLVGMARVEIWLAGHLKDVDDRQKAAARAIDASQWCGRIQPDDAVCDYWLAAALGVQAREKPSTGIKALPLIVDNFKRAAEEVPAYDFGGPDRALALVYLRAPGWPTGPGDPALGVEHARKAIAEAPVYPPNLMALGEALAATGDREGSREAYEKALDQARVRAAAGEDAEAEEWVRDARSALGAPSGEGGGG